MLYEYYTYSDELLGILVDGMVSSLPREELASAHYNMTEGNINCFLVDEVVNDVGGFCLFEETPNYTEIAYQCDNNVWNLLIVEWVGYCLDDGIEHDTHETMGDLINLQEGTRISKALASTPIERGSREWNMIVDLIGMALL